MPTQSHYADAGPDALEPWTVPEKKNMQKRRRKTRILLTAGIEPKIKFYKKTI